MKKHVLATMAMLTLSAAMPVMAQMPMVRSADGFKDEFRKPWTRGGTDYIRNWVVAGPIACKLDEECLPGEAALRPKADEESKRADGSVVKWRASRPWGDSAGTGGENATADKMAYAFATITRDKAGKATLSLGSANAIRAWVNGKLVLKRDGERAWSPDNDLVEVDLNAGENALLIKLASTSSYIARVLETGAVPDRLNEITPSLIEASDTAFTLITDVSAARAAHDAVDIEVLRPGGEVVHTGNAKRGARVRVDAARWPDGPYEVRLITKTALGLRYTTHIPWYKGNALVKARELAAEAAKADDTRAEGFTLKMLANMVDDRLGMKLAEAQGNPWSAIHAALMEYDELMLERAGKVGRVRPWGFVRLGWIDDIDNTPQYCRAYLPGGYSAAKKWPLVLQLHGFNPANPVYWDWWSADNRYNNVETEIAGHGGVIFIEPHGRGNVQYLAFGDRDVMRCMAEARKLFSIDENRTYLTGDSMGGWGTWNVATRHPELFAAIAPIFGGVDYHSTMSKEEAARLSPAELFIQERRSSWSMADGLINTPVYVHHGDMDAAVNVEWSRYGVRLLQRWGYDIRYREYPGKVHEALQVNNGTMNFDWFLKHVRDPDPRKVRIRSAELRNAQAWWARVLQFGRPMEFMRVDAEVMDRNVIRLDTDNVVDIVLTPSAKLIDPAQPVKVVWNGEAREMRLDAGELRLTRAEYKPAKLHKSPALPGSTGDFFNTPYAVVIGTTSKDAAVRELLERKAKEFSDAWLGWQKFAPRVFKDVDMTDADIAKYSLMLIGGAAENAVSAKLAAKLPSKLAADRVVIDGKAFPVRDAGLQLLYPHPRNPERYLWLFAGNSANGLKLIRPTPFLSYDWDFIIVDGTIPAARQSAQPERTNVASGSFDSNWRLDLANVQLGDEAIRTKGRKLPAADKPVKVEPALLDSYVGQYVLPNGNVVEITRRDAALWAKVGPEELEFVPMDQTTFYGEKFNVWATFEKDAAGKVTGFAGHQQGEGDFDAKRK